MLSFLISVPIIVLALWLIVRGFSRFCRRKAGWWWRTVFVAMLAVGGYVGFCLAYCDVRLSPSFRWVGLPLPIGFFQLEDEQWTDFVPPRPVQLMNLAADTLAPIIILLVPLLVVHSASRRVAATAKVIPSP